MPGAGSARSIGGAAAASLLLLLVLALVSRSPFAAPSLDIPWVASLLGSGGCSAGAEECDLCSSEELQRLRTLYREHQAKLSHSPGRAEGEGDGHSGSTTAGQGASAGAAGAHAHADAGVGAGAHRSLLQTSDLRSVIEEKDEEMEKAQVSYRDLKKALSRQQMEVENLENMLMVTKGEFDPKALKDYRGGSASLLSDKAQEFVQQCKSNLAADLTTPENKDWAIYKGYACEATEAELKQYMAYELRGLCPDDWFFVQHLIFVKNCFALPKRRCLTRTPQKFVEPLPRAHALFNQDALQDGSVRWGHHACGSYECLNTRASGDCKSCFNMTLEANRWRVRYRGSLTIKEVVEMKGGALRLGLDAGRGTGSFAAHMARYNVTVMTMAMDIEARAGERKGLPYMETIAQRGLIPLHVPHTARLPFFDNILDLVHCVNSVKYLPLGEFEDLLYEWDRVLRAGGIMWFELFYAPEDEMKVYVQIIELLKYKKLYWEFSKKPLEETKGVQHVYLNAVIEKPARADAGPTASAEEGKEKAG